MQYVEYAKVVCLAFCTLRSCLWFLRKPIHTISGFVVIHALEMHLLYWYPG